MSSAQGTYKSGVQVGTWVVYDGADGTDGTDGTDKVASGRYANGKQVGRWTFFYEDGAQRTSGVFRNGLPHGKWTERDEDGAVLSRRVFKNGRLIREDGKPVPPEGHTAYETLPGELPRAFEPPRTSAIFEIE